MSNNRFFSFIRKRDCKTIFIGLTVWPLVIAYLSIPIGVQTSIGQYHGYLCLDNYNWLINILLLPTSFFVVRWFIKKMFSDPSKNLPDDVPILMSIEDAEKKIIANSYLEEFVFRNRTLIIAIILG